MSSVQTVHYDAPTLAAGSGDQRRHRLAGFLELLEIDARQAGEHSQSMEQMVRGDIQAVIVHNVFPAAAMAQVVARLCRSDHGLLQTWFPPKFRSWFYGRNVNLAEPDLQAYFQESSEFMPALEQVFAPAGGFEGPIARVISLLDGGRPFMAPPGPLADQSYMLATLRAHMDQGYISAHFDNEQSLRPSYAHLSTLVGLHMTSFVLTLDPGGSGGALQIYRLRCDPEEARLLSDDAFGVKPDLSTLDSVCLRVPPGAMVVLDSGRYLHRVSPVTSGDWRWTACGFMAVSHDGGTRYCWG